MKKIVAIILFALLGLLVVPVLITQVRGPMERQLEAVRLQEVEFQEVKFENAEQGLVLGGMLFVPEGEGPFPAAVIIHGSGPSRRDNGWYLTLAHYLQNNGILVLLPDKRGSEQSEGNWQTSSFEDLATDTLAGIRFLQGHQALDIDKVGVIGLSQGGQIAPIVAHQSDSVKFLVNIVGGAVPMHRTLIYEENHNLREMGVLPGFSNFLAYPAAWSIIYARQSEFWNAIGNFDPGPYWKDIEVPSFILYGEMDTNTPSVKSTEVLHSFGNSNIRVKIYPESGHALESPPGAGNSIFRQDALRDILEFIKRENVPD